MMRELLPKVKRRTISVFRTMGLKVWFTIATLGALAVLLAQVDRLDPYAWVPSLASNLFTMLVTVVILDALFKSQRQRKAGEILRTSVLNIAQHLYYTADPLVEFIEYPVHANANAESRFTRIIEDWQYTRDAFERDLSYCTTDLDHSLRQHIKELEEKIRLFANMGWGNYKGESVLVAKDVLSAWQLLRDIQKRLYVHDEGVTSILSQIQEISIDKMVAAFTPYWEPRKEN